MRGEEAFTAVFGGSVDLVPRPGGDKGVDHILKLPDGEFAVDIKTARKPGNLIVEKGKIKPRTIYMLASYNDETDLAGLLGWEWGAVLAKAPVKDFGYGVLNHYIPRDRLRSIIELIDRAAVHVAPQQPPTPNASPHLCHCGLYGSFGWLKDGNPVWYCKDHYPK